MKREIRHDKKAIIYWLSKEESQHPQARQVIKEDVASLALKKYKTVIFKSGNESLYDNTLALLKENKKGFSKKKTNVS